MGTWRGRRGNPSRTCPFPLQGSSAPGAPPSTRSPSVSPPSLCRGHLLCAGTLSGGAGAVGSTHPGGDMGTMSPKSSSPRDSRGLQNMMDEPPLERGQSPSCPAVGEGAAGGDVGPLGGVTQVTKHRAWTGALVPAVTPLWVSPCPRHPRSFPRAHPAPAPAPPLLPPSPGNESQMWPRCGRGGSSVPPWVASSHLQRSVYPGTCHCQVWGLQPRPPPCSPRLGAGQRGPHRPEGTEPARFTEGRCGCGGGARCHRPILQV